MCHYNALSGFFNHEMATEPDRRGSKSPIRPEYAAGDQDARC